MSFVGRIKGWLKNARAALAAGLLGSAAVIVPVTATEAPRSEPVEFAQPASKVAQPSMLARVLVGSTSLASNPKIISDMAAPSGTKGEIALVTVAVLATSWSALPRFSQPQQVRFTDEHISVIGRRTDHGIGPRAP